jgi:hypothetical protein
MTKSESLSCLQYLFDKHNQQFAMNNPEYLRYLEDPQDPDARSLLSCAICYAEINGHWLQPQIEDACQLNESEAFKNCEAIQTALVPNSEGIISWCVADYVAAFHSLATFSCASFLEIMRDRVYFNEGNNWL